MGKNCVLVEGGFADLVQLALGVIAIGVLVVKRYREKPRRPWDHWALDVSKQAIGALMAHGLNILLADFLSSTSTADQDQCSWYAINFTTDTLVGVFIAWVALHQLEQLAKRCNWPRLQRTGYYHAVPDVPKTWLLQLISWLLIVCLAKAVLLGLLMLLLNPLAEFGVWAFGPFDNDPKAELVVVMILGPCLLNAAQFWIQDNFLKAKFVDRRHGYGSMDENDEDSAGRAAGTGGAAGPLLEKNKPRRQHSNRAPLAVERDAESASSGGSGEDPPRHLQRAASNGSTRGGGGAAGVGSTPRDSDDGGVDGAYMEASVSQYAVAGTSAGSATSALSNAVTM